MKTVKRYVSGYSIKQSKSGEYFIYRDKIRQNTGFKLERLKDARWMVYCFTH